MLADDPTSEKGLTYDGHPVVEGCGLYIRGKKSDGEGYLYTESEQLKTLPTPEELRAMKGKSIRLKDDQGRRYSKKQPALLYLPLAVDTEYQTLPNADKYPALNKEILRLLHIVDRGSLPLTVQATTIRPTVHGIGTYVHPLFRKAFPRCRPILEAPRNPVEAYLQRLYPNSKIQELSSETESLRTARNIRILRLDLFAHFAVADYLKIWPAGPIHDHLLSLSTGEDEVIDQQRRLKIEVETKLRNNRTHRTRWTRLPAMVTLNGVPFALELGIFDTCALAGQAGMALKGLHSCAGSTLDAKDNYEKRQKEVMIFPFIASCDPESVKRGVYDKLSEAAPGVLDEALIGQASYSTGNLFVDYAEGDVMLYQAVDGYDRQFRDLYDNLSLTDYYKSPKPTVGSTVHDLLKASVFRYFENGETLTKKQQKFIIEKGFIPARARGLAERSTWAAANARVFGGRVLSTAPTLVSRKNAAVCDMDLGGAYARSMDCQLLPVGIPVIDIEYSRTSRRNEHKTLEKYLATTEKQFVPGCWQLIISVEDEEGNPLDLPSDQDYFTSWSTPAIFDSLKALTEEDGVWLERSDDVRVYTRQIFNSVLTHDGLQWIRHCASPGLRKFLMENAVVKASMYYPACERVAGDDPQEWLRIIEEEEGNGRKNTCEVSHKAKRTEVKKTDRECHQWIGIPVKDLLTGALTDERNRWKAFTDGYDTLRKKGVTCIEQLSKLTTEQRKEFDRLAFEHEGGHPGGPEGLIEASLAGGKHPKDELSKLAGNTVYGDLVSRFFELSNPLCGNNITARVRSVIWFFEKSCRAWNSITDGGLFDLNEVHAIRENHRGRLNEKNTVFAPEAGYKILRNEGIVLKPLGFDEDDPVLSWSWDGDRVVVERESGKQTVEVKAAQEMINQMTLAQVQRSFSQKIDVVNKAISPFKFEAKGVVKDAAIHGTANYCLRGGKHGSYKPDEGKNWTIKLRSYPSSTHDKVLKPFFDQLIDNPEAVDRARYWSPFTLPSILKVRKFRDSYHTHFRDTVLEPGDTDYSVKVFREFTPSAFRFQTVQQERHFLNFHQAHRELGNAKNPGGSKSKGQSFESFFTDDNNVLNYKQMMLEVEAAIRDGRNSIHPELEVEQHPQQEKAVEMKKKLWRDVVKDGRKYAQVDSRQPDLFDTFLDPDGLPYDDLTPEDFEDLL